MPGAGVPCDPSPHRGAVSSRHGQPLSSHNSSTKTNCLNETPGGGGGGADETPTTMCFSPPQTCTELGRQNTRESDSRRPRHPEPSATKNSSSSRAASNWTECEKCHKMRQNPPSDVLRRLIRILSRFHCANRAETTKPTSRPQDSCPPSRRKTPEILQQASVADV